MNGRASIVRFSGDCQRQALLRFVRRTGTANGKNLVELIDPAKLTKRRMPSIEKLSRPSEEGVELVRINNKINYEPNRG